MRVRSYISFALSVLFFGIAMADPIQLVTSDGQTLVTYKGIQFQQIDAKHSRYLLTQGVVAKFKKTSVTLSSDHATVFATTEGEKTELTSVDAVGSVKLVKSERRTIGSVISTLASSEINYINQKAGSTAVCKNAILLTQTDPAKHSTLQATGGSGNASFLGGVDLKDNRLIKAILHTPVEMKLNQAPVAGKKSVQAHITCSEMVYKPTATGEASLELSGNIHITSNQGTVSNLNHATIHLNEKHELKDFQGSGS